MSATPGPWVAVAVTTGFAVKGYGRFAVGSYAMPRVFKTERSAVRHADRMNALDATRNADAAIASAEGKS